MYIAVIILAALLPVMTITAFITGYNMTAEKKIQVAPKPKPKPHKPTDTEIMLQRIENATIYKTETDE